MYNTTVLRGEGKFHVKMYYTTRENLFFAFFHQPILTLPHPSSYHNIVGEEMDRREKKILTDDATMTEFNFIHG